VGGVVAFKDGPDLESRFLDLQLQLHQLDMTLL
jgi:hypothetical protein